MKKTTLGYDIVTPEMVAWNRSIQWENEKTDELRRLTGFDAVAFGWDGRAERWTIATKQVKAVTADGMPDTDGLTFVDYYHPVQRWEYISDDRDDPRNGEPLPVEMGRVAEIVRAMRHAALHTQQMWDAKKARERQAEQSRTRELVAQWRSKDMVAAAQKLIERRMGFVGREGEGGTRKFFYDGCLS